jgi:hypothetical protein
VDLLPALRLDPATRSTEGLLEAVIPKRLYQIVHRGGVERVECVGGDKMVAGSRLVIVVLSVIVPAPDVARATAAPAAVLVP